MPYAPICWLPREFSTAFCDNLNGARVPGWTLSLQVANDSLYSWPESQFGDGSEPRLVYLAVGPLSSASLAQEKAARGEVFVNCLNMTKEFGSSNLPSMTHTFITGMSDLENSCIVVNRPDVYNNLRNGVHGMELQVHPCTRPNAPISRSPDF